MTKQEAREHIMRETQYAMKQYREMHKGEKIDLDKQLEYVNHFLKMLVPEEIRQMAE